MPERTFTLHEATELLPVLESLLKRAMEGKRVVEEKDKEFQELASRIMIAGGLFVDLVYWAERRAVREKAAQQARDAVAEIDATGVQVKDLDIGLLDFPCIVDDQLILLCWKSGEPAITHWHGVDEGFAGRKPVDARIANARKPDNPH
jgi:hypothetical protein